MPSRHMPCRYRSLLCSISVLWIGAIGSVGQTQEAAEPVRSEVAKTTVFHVPGFEREMAWLERMHVRHQQHAFSDCTLWDRWLPHASLWTGPEAVRKYRLSLLKRRIDSEGYVAVQQHRGMAHCDGWPFPAWQQSTGVGFHFSFDHDHWAVHHFRTPVISDLEGWIIDGAEVQGIDPQLGLHLKLVSPTATITTPSFRCGTIVAPFVRLEWSTPDWPATAVARLRWQFENEATSPMERNVVFEPESRDGQMSFVNIPTYRHPDYAGLLNRYHLEIQSDVGKEITLKSLLTAIDSRHPITNSNYLRACIEYFNWTHDIEFLRANLPRMRRAANYLVVEFGLREHSHVIVPWVGHDGRSGIVYDAQGQKTVRPGLGVGNNYWDLLPFGGHDALATIYAYDALGLLANLEEAVALHPEWLVENETKQDSARVQSPLSRFVTATELRDLAAKIRADFQQRFWNERDGRFIGWEDLTGQRYDYGFTFVNLEAIYYGLASRNQADQIFAWLDGTRVIAGDTSQGADIYHWRFAPRATTRRNIDSYVWAWLSPESIEWGGQVQDGGAVLGFSYFDIMSRLETQGPDQAWQRLRTIIDWYAQVESEGGYRTYYGKPGRGTLQGGGTAGGLGLDHEFFESVLVPQVMLYGFLGFEPTAMGYRINPRLPKDWPSLTIDNIHHDQKRLTITAFPDGSHKVVEN
jgi:hypothetical protein